MMDETIATFSVESMASFIKNAWVCAQETRSSETARRYMCYGVSVDICQLLID